MIFKVPSNPYRLMILCHASVICVSDTRLSPILFTAGLQLCCHVRGVVQSLLLLIESLKYTV